jgi:non-canonical purine NTP pyrophosphatase (RdgB/HAM1 family)
VTDFVLATANHDKAKEIADILGPSVHLLRRPDWVDEVDETGETLLDNARLKARAVAEATNRPAIADDTGLEVEDLGGQPGVRSARFAGEHATYADNVAELMARLADSQGRRLARFRTVAIAAWPDGREVVAEGVVDGVIASEPRGRAGFGYDPVFVPDEGDGRTFAEMSPGEKNLLSHRGRAFRALEENLSGLDGAMIEGAAVADTHVDRSQASGSAPDGDSDKNWWSAGKLLTVDLVLAVVVGAAVLLVHDVPYMLHHPFWVDEAWVADSVRARLGLTPTLTSATPVGWTLLLRMIPFGGAQRLRLVPLGFTVLAAASGYWLGRELKISRFTTGILTGAAVLLSPAMLLRDDLKQYTAEAFTSILLLVLVARVENDWTRWRLALIGLATVVGLFFSNTVIFVGVAAMAGLALECLIRRHFRRLLEVGCASGAMLALSLGLYVLVDRSHVTASITAFWDGYYIPRNQGLHGAWRYVDTRLHQLAPYLGFHSLRLDAALILAGIVALIWLGRYALAAMFPLTLLAVAVASADRRFPFGDLRTSTFWLVMAPVLMAVAVAVVGRAIAAINRPAAFATGAVLLAFWVSSAHPDIRSHPLPNEDIRSQVEYLNGHVRPGDIVVVDYTGSYGFAYYDHRLRPVFVHDSFPSQGFIPQFPGDSEVVIMPNRRAEDVANALATATAKLDAESPGDRGRIWILRTHVDSVESDAWTKDLAGQKVTVLQVGPEPLLLYVPS